VGEEQLRHVAPALLERPFVGPHEGRLPDGGGGLLERHRPGRSAIPSFFLPAAIAPEVTTTKETPDSDQAEESCAARARMVGSAALLGVGNRTAPQLDHDLRTRGAPRSPARGSRFAVQATCDRFFLRASIPSSRGAIPSRWPRR